MATRTSPRKRKASAEASPSKRVAPRQRDKPLLVQLSNAEEQEESDEEGKYKMGQDEPLRYTDEYGVARSHRYQLREGERIVLTLTAMELNMFALRSMYTHGRVYEVLDAMDDEMQRFGTALLTENANLRTEELSKARSFGFIEYIDVAGKAEHRRQGLGSEALRQLLQHETFERCTYVFANPRGSDETLAFFRKNGFRSVGATDWLCYAVDASHPSRQIAAEDDFDPPRQERRQAQPPLGMDMAAMGDLAAADSLAREFPLHSAIANWQRGRPLPVSATTSSAQLTARDDQAFTPLHVALGCSRWEIARQILSLPNAQVYAAAVGGDGRSALDVARQSRQESDAFRMAFGLPDRDGDKAAALAVEQRIKQLTGYADASSCTCGQCKEGWLSPRLAHRLLVGAEISADLMRDNMEWFKNGVALQSDDLAMLPGYDALPSRMIQEGLHKTTYSSWISLHDGLAQLLRRNVTPTPELIRSEAFNTTAHFRVGPTTWFQKGGTMRAVLDHVLQWAWSEEPEMDQMWEDEENEAGMLRCANDGDQELAREKLDDGHGE